MQKEMLRKLSALPATREMMFKGKQYTERTEKYWYAGKYRTVIEPRYDVLARGKNFGKILKIAIFIPKDMRKNIKTPRYEVFLNVEGQEYISRELDEKGEEVRWSEAMIHNLIRDHIPYNYTAYITKDLHNSINELEVFNGKLRDLKRVAVWQQDLKDLQTERREVKEQEPWDKDMALVPELPKDFEEWMRKDVCKDNYIIYEYSKKGAKEGYCSRCKKIVPIKNPKHNTETKCPRCHANAIYKSHSRLVTLATESYEAEIIQKTKEGIVIRRFTQYQYYRGADYKEPNVVTHEKFRTLFFNEGKQRIYEYGFYKQKKHRWIPAGQYSYYGGYLRSQCALYKKNLKKVIETSDYLKHSAIGLWNRLPMSTVRYLENEAGNPAIEKLAKIRLFDLARDLMNADYSINLLEQEATELSKMLKIDNARLTRLRNLPISNLATLMWLRKEKEMNTVFPDEVIVRFSAENIKPTALEILKDLGLSYIQLNNYIKKQQGIMGENQNQVISTWKDYLQMANKNKLDTSIEQVYKPKDLKAAHDHMIFLSNKGEIDKLAKDLAKQWPKVKDQLQKLKKYEFKLGDYEILAPSSIADIVKEGIILSHCIHRCDYYFQRITDDESYIFFLRKSAYSDTPWYTLEVEPSGNIRQKRTTGDNQNKDFEDAIKFLKKWQKHFQKQLTAEEKELGKKADILRKENYKQLRKDQKKVWHGKLAGKLLADVLESDFMAAVGG